MVAYVLLHMQTASPDALLIIFELGILILSVIMHEVAHGYAADALGDPTARLSGRLTLNPVPHIDPVGSVLVPAFLVLTGAGIMFGWAKPVPYNPYNLRNQRWGEAMVAFAGPGTNLILAVVLGLIARFGNGTLPDPFIMLAALAAFINLFLGLFNLIPLPPLDGYKVLRGLLPYRFSTTLREVEFKIQNGGFISLIIVLVVFSYVLAVPFSLLVNYLFTLIVGG